MIARLDRTLREAGIPLVGVVVGRVDDKRTWVVQCQPEATAAQRLAADTLVEAFVTDDPAADFAIEAARTRRERALCLCVLHATLGRWPTQEEIDADEAVWLEAYTRAGAARPEAAPRVARTRKRTPARKTARHK